jgi:hypothetical protein
MKKLLFIVGVMFFCVGYISAQEEDNNIFTHLGVGLGVGTTGIDIQVAAPLTDNFEVRAGYSIMPKFKYKKNVNLGSDPAFLEDPQKVDVEGKLNMGDFKLLVDYFPLKSSSFHLTAGAFLGKSNPVEIYNANAFLQPSAYGNKGLELGTGANSYTLVSESDGSVRAEVKTNSFKPYFGIGFGRAVPKGSVGVQFDLGVQLWGTPELWGIINSVNQETGMPETKYQKIDKDRIVTENKDKGYKDFKDAVDFIEKVVVYPVLTLRINGRIF